MEESVTRVFGKADHCEAFSARASVVAVVRAVRRWAPVLALLSVSSSFAFCQSVLNFGFETGSASPWQILSGSNATVVKSPVHSGSYALSMSGAANTYVVQTVYGLTAGQQYLVSAWVDVASSNTAVLDVDDSVSSSTAQQASQGQTNGWEFISVPFTADSSNAMNVHLCSAATGAIYWDDVSVVPLLATGNYGFETGSVSPWQISSGSNAAVVKSTVHSGSYALSMSSPANSGVIQTVSGLTAGQQYVVSAWVDLSPGNTALLIVDDSASSSTAQTVSQGQTSGWQLISVPFTADSTGAMNVHLWSSGTGAIYWDDVSVAIELVFASTTFSANNFRLSQGESVYLGSLTLVMQADGNLVVDRGSTALWSTGTGGQNCGTNECFAVFQGDGNFVVYNGTTALWASGTSGNSGAELVLSATSPYIDIVNTGEAILWSSSGPPLSPSNPSREFIYFNGQLIAVENHP